MPYIFQISRRQTGRRPAGRQNQASKGERMRAMKLLAVLVLAIAAGLAGYAYFGDMEPARSEVRTPLPLESQ